MSMLAGVAQQQGNRVVSVGAAVNAVPPAISGAAYAGLTMSCTTGTWSNPGGGYGYQWKSGGAAIAGGTASTSPVFTIANEGTVITCDVTTDGVTASSNAIHNWMPSDLAGLATWGDRKNTAGITLSGSEVAAVSDRSGNGRGWVQTINIRRPINSGTLNGEPSFSFPDETRFLLSEGSALTAGATTYVFIGKADSFATHAYIAGGTTLIPLSSVGSTSAAILRVNNTNYNAGAAGTQFLFDGEIAESVTTQGTVNSKLVASSLMICTAPLASTTWNIGRGSSTYGASGDHGEWFIVSGSLSDADKKRIQGYAAWRWNFVTALGVHDYDDSNGAPTV